MILDKKQRSSTGEKRWVTGDLFGIDIPADAESLISAGPEFLTAAFRACGTIDADNRVSQISSSKEFVGGGTGKKLLLSIQYQVPESRLPEQLFIKFSRNFDNELWDRGRFQMISEVNFAVLSRSPDFPVAVPACLFADIESTSGTGLLVTECINYGTEGVERLYPKCMDYTMPDPLGHYRAILRGLARLSGAHRSGRLPAEFNTRFPHNRGQAMAMLSIPATEEKLVQRARRMFDFIERYPKLFPDSVRSPALREQFIGDIPDVLAAEDRMKDVLYGNPDLIAFAHWNANIDNCWFWRDAGDVLHAGFMDWANAGQISLAQSVSGAISGAECFIWDHHLDDLLRTFINEYAASGGGQLSLDELRLHCLLIVVISGVAYAMGAPVAIEREIENIAMLESYQDERFRIHENARIQLHMMTKTLNVWQAWKLGDVVRTL